MQDVSLTPGSEVLDLSSRLDFNATTVLLGLSIVNIAKQQLKGPLSKAKLTMNQWLVLKILFLKKADTPTNVAKAIDADPTTISRHLDSLETRGLIERKHTSNDRRVIQLLTTQKGNDIAEEIYKCYSELLQNLDENLSKPQMTLWNEIEKCITTHMKEPVN